METVAATAGAGGPLKRNSCPTKIRYGEAMPFQAARSRKSNPCLNAMEYSVSPCTTWYVCAVALAATDDDVAFSFGSDRSTTGAGGFEAQPASHTPPVASNVRNVVWMSIRIG